MSHPWENDGDDDAPWDKHKDEGWRGDVHPPDLDATGLKFKNVSPDGGSPLARLCATVGLEMMQMILRGVTDPHFLVLSVPDYQALLHAAQCEWGEDVDHIAEMNGLRVVTSDVAFNRYATILDEAQRILVTFEIDLTGA